MVKCVHCDIKLTARTRERLVGTGMMGFYEAGRPPMWRCIDAEKCARRANRRRLVIKQKDEIKVPPPGTIVHFMMYGQTPCLMPTPPSEWPDRHKWSSDWTEVTCKDCRLGKDTIVPTYTISADGRSITCLRCEQTSYNQEDVDARYCSCCHVSHEDIWPPARKWWVENKDPRMPFAKAFTRFQKALDDMVKAERALTVVTATEPVRERARRSRLQATSLYNDLLTQLQQAGIEPICRVLEDKP